MVQIVDAFLKSGRTLAFLTAKSCFKYPRRALVQGLNTWYELRPTVTVKESVFLAELVASLVFITLDEKICNPTAGVKYF